MELVVHPGIGDISWVVSKLSTTGQQYDLVIAKDNKTRRAMPLVEMMPCIRSARYGGLEIYEMLARAGNAKWEEFVQAGEEGKTLYLTANKWLEKGNRLEGFLPDLDTDFHYPIHIPPADTAWAQSAVDPYPRTMGIYTSSWGGIVNWAGWTELEWLEFIRLVREHWTHTTFFLIGARWDMDMRLPMLKGLERERIDYVDLIGKTSLSRAAALIQQLDYFAGYASGLTVLADVVRKPCLMLYPDHLSQLMGAWPDPVHLADGTHQGHLWDRPLRVVRKIAPQLDKYLGG